MNEAYNVGFAPKCSVYILKEIIALAQSYIYDARKNKKNKTRKKIYAIQK